MHVSQVALRLKTFDRRDNPFVLHAHVTREKKITEKEEFTLLYVFENITIATRPHRGNKKLTNGLRLQRQARGCLSPRRNSRNKPKTKNNLFTDSHPYLHIVDVKEVHVPLLCERVRAERQAESGQMRVPVGVACTVSREGRFFLHENNRQLERDTLLGYHLE